MLNSELEFFIKKEEDVILYADILAGIIIPRDVLGLKGEVGSGKTTFARALIRILAGDMSLEVPSPTFTLMQSYDGRIKVHHLDLYRLQNPEEIDELGLEELLKDSLGIIEWPEKAEEKMPKETLRIQFFYQNKGRHARIMFMEKNPARFSSFFTKMQLLQESGNL